MVQAITVSLGGTAASSEDWSSVDGAGGEGENGDVDGTRLDDEFTVIDAVLVRPNAAIEQAKHRASKRE